MCCLIKLIHTNARLQIAFLWTCCTCKGQKKVEAGAVRQPHATQIVAVLRLLGVDEDGLKHHLIEVRVFCVLLVYRHSM